MSIQGLTGLTIIEDFISPRKEEELLSFIDSQPWSDVLKRRVQHYGFSYSYTPPYKVGKAPKIPPLFREIAGEIDPLLNQTIVNEYTPGQGIAPHVDHKTLFGDTVASLSLGSATTMVLSYGGVKEEIRLEPRSVIILQDDARWKWAHSIPARKSDLVDGKRVPRGRRVSLTFRTYLS